MCIQLFLIAIGVSLAVIVFQIQSITRTKEPIMNVAKFITDIGVPLGLDTDGYIAGCRSDGMALSVSSKSGFMTVDVRIKEGEPMLCMTKDEVKNFMASNGVDDSEIEEILAIYPNFKTL